MKITAPYRGRRASKRLDLTDMREVFRDRRTWCAIGVVTVPDGAAAHFEISATDILVDVILQPSLHDVTCRLAAGMWLLPDVGEEVVVVLPEGEMSFMPTIVGILSSGVVPTAQQPTPQRIAIVRPEVVVHDGSGGAVSLAVLTSLQATIDKLNDLITAYNGHVHTGGTISGSTGVTGTLIADGASDGVGTTVLKGK